MIRSVADLSSKATLPPAVESEELCRQGCAVLHPSRKADAAEVEKREARGHGPRNAEDPLSVGWVDFPRTDELLDSTFSAVSTPIFATKYSFCSVFRDLEDFHPFAQLETQNFSKIPFKLLKF